MIAVQPRTGLEEIEQKRQLLRLKVEHRKIAEALSTSRASTSLGTLFLDDDKGPSPYNLSSRSPSPAPKSRPTQGKVNSYYVRKKLADSTSQAIKVTKKVMNNSNKNKPNNILGAINNPPITQPTRRDAKTTTTTGSKSKTSK